MSILEESYQDLTGNNELWKKWKKSLTQKYNQRLILFKSYLKLKLIFLESVDHIFLERIHSLQSLYFLFQLNVMKRKDKK